MTAYYNEIDPYAASWLERLIAAGHIAPGVVDRRSILDVSPDDLAAFTQCHFFAGIGVWSYALRRAGVSDDTPLWTGSCPCQPFSAAGKGGGFDDERHLWPAWFHLIDSVRPRRVLGEQVASKDGLAWLDLVQSDMEATNYAFGAVDLCAAGVGAPHIRQRLWFLADAHDARSQGRRGMSERADQRAVRSGGVAGILANATTGERREECADAGRLDARDGAQGIAAGLGASGGDMRPGPTNGFWSLSDWLRCRDDRWRPVEPGTFPLAHGAPARVGRLRAYGNAINAQAAEEFIRAAFA